MTSILPLVPSVTGAPPKPILYKEVTYNDKEYVVCFVETATGCQPFIIDKEKLPLLLAYPSWHVTAGAYISTSVIVDGKKKSLYLHNLVMGKLTFGGKGQTSSVDHINRIGFDNRLENLRVISQTEQNLNQSKKPRSITLPEGCGIEPDSIPRHIWYVKASGGHGDRFAIEFKIEGILWRTTSSKTVTLLDKLESAKAKLLEFYSIYPYLNPDNPEVVGLYTSLVNSYNEIIAAAS